MAAHNQAELIRRKRVGIYKQLADLARERAKVARARPIPLRWAQVLGARLYWTNGLHRSRTKWRNAARTPANGKQYLAATNEQHQRALTLRADADDNLTRLKHTPRLHLIAPAFGHNDCSTCALRNANLWLRWRPTPLPTMVSWQARYMLSNLAQHHGRHRGYGLSRAVSESAQRSNMDGTDPEAPMQQSPALSPPCTREPQSWQIGSVPH